MGGRGGLSALGRHGTEELLGTLRGAGRRGAGPSLAIGRF